MITKKYVEYNNFCDKNKAITIDSLIQTVDKVAKTRRIKSIDLLASLVNGGGCNSLHSEGL